MTDGVAMFRLPIGSEASTGTELLGTRDRGLGTPGRSPLGDILAEHRFHIDDRGPVDRLEVFDAHAQPIDLRHFDPMEPDRIRPMRGTRVEDALRRPRCITAWLNDQHGAMRAVEPGEQHEVGPRLDTSQACRYVRLEYQPSLRCPFVRLSRGGREVLELRFDSADRFEMDAHRI